MFRQDILRYTTWTKLLRGDVKSGPVGHSGGKPTVKPEYEAGWMSIPSRTVRQPRVQSIANHAKAISLHACINMIHV